MISILSFWGKASPCVQAPAAAWHPVAYHSLDVAATVSCYLAVNPSVEMRLAELLGVSRDETSRLGAFAAACHDLGKFGLGFQSKVPELFLTLFPSESLTVENGSHSAVGLRTFLQFLSRSWYPEVDEEYASTCLEPLANAACGHHGRPEQLSAGAALQGIAETAVSAFVAQVAALFDMDRPPAAFRPGADSGSEAVLRTALPRIQEASWLLAGVITLCDWVGSSQEYFPYAHPTLSLEKYWLESLGRAAVAISACGLSEKTASASSGFEWLYGAQRAADEPGFVAMAPSPLQSWADSVVLPAKAQPTLFVLEDETGAGKTEAALTLASRLVSAGFGRGVLFSLPTQTTANAVFSRVQAVAPRFFAPGAMPTVSLAHGNAKMALGRMKATQAPAGTITSDLESWSQESAKTALLADFGVGTVDQVALAGLPVRHVVLRHLGLAKKVLIIDEAHACEPYLLDILKNSLKQHAKLGGSAIILSATLPRATKQGLVDAFECGVRAADAPAASPRVGHPAYPLATAYWHSTLTEFPLAARKEPRELKFQPIVEKDACPLITSWITEGKCVCFLRNTVSSAQAAYDYYNALYPGQVSLVHARFVNAHRGANDDALLSSFGKSSTSVSRAGQLVIATQVAEQSLDVDFDELLTDLAPLDSLLQRAGRRRRHSRDAEGNPTPIEGREQGPMYVITPDVVNNPKFLSELSAGTAFVYPLPGVLYRTAEIVQNWASIQIPGQVREAVEFAYDETAVVPEFLLQADDVSLSRTMAAQQHARVSRLYVDAGYSCHAGITLADHSVTRLGEPSVGVVVCDHNGRPLFGDGNAFSVELSQLSIRASVLTTPRADDGRIWLRMQEAGDNTWKARVQGWKGKELSATYSKATGFSLS